MFSVPKLRSETRSEAVLPVLNVEKELLREHGISDCHVSLGVRVDASKKLKYVRSEARAVLNVEKELFREHGIRDCHVNLGVRVDESKKSKYVRSEARETANYEKQSEHASA